MSLLSSEGRPRLDRKAGKVTWVRRGFLILAGLALVASFVLGVLPTHATVVVSSPPPVMEKVNCGTVFSSTKWSNDDNCEPLLLNQSGLMIGAFLLGFVSGAIGFGLYLSEARRRP